MLQCPKCHEPLIKKEKVYCCNQRHSFDIAKRGYCNLLLGNHKATGDDAKMVTARTNFLEHGYYKPLQRKVIEVLENISIHTLVDAGCGQGYYTNKIKEDIQSLEIFGFDLSKTAIDQACRQRKGIHYFVASVFHFPLKEESVDAILSIFAPINADENTRILKSHGYFIKVEPGPKHLEDLKTFLYDTVYDNEAKAKEYPNFTLIHEELLDYHIEIHKQEDIQALFQMTPYYWKTPKESVDKLYHLEYLKTRVQFHIEIYEKQI